MIISATEFKVNLGKYLDMAKHEEILITKNGKAIVKLTSIADGKLAALDSLAGIMESEADDAAEPKE